MRKNDDGKKHLMDEYGRGEIVGVVSDSIYCPSHSFDYVLSG